MPEGNEKPPDGVSEWFNGVPIDVIDNYVLARLDGRALGRMILSSRVLRDLVDDNHPAWWSAHSQMLTGKLRLIKVTTRESHRTPQAQAPKPDEQAKSVFLSTLRDTCMMCGSRGVMELRIPSTKRALCGPCTSAHPHTKDFYVKQGRRVSSQVMVKEVGIRREKLQGILSEPTISDKLLRGYPAKQLSLLFSTRYNGRAMTSFWQHTQEIAWTLLVVETRCGAVMGALVQEPWRNSGGKDYGSEGNVLWTLKPQLKLYASSRGASGGIQRGEAGSIGLGGDRTQPALSLDSDFTRGRSSPTHTYRNPPLMPDSPFEVTHVEVWAVQPEEDDDEDEEEQNFFVDEIAEMRNPKKKSVLKNGVERFMLSFVGVGGALSAAMHVRNHA